MENLKKVVALVVEGANVGFGVAETKNFAMLANLMDEALALASVDWKALPGEAADYDAGEMKEFINTKFDISNDELEGKIEAIVGAALKVGEVVITMIDIFKK
jgi:hypothetical protein